jgi:hypothetical protein
MMFDLLLDNVCGVVTYKDDVFSSVHESAANLRPACSSSLRNCAPSATPNWPVNTCSVDKVNSTTSARYFIIFSKVFGTVLVADDGWTHLLASGPTNELEAATALLCRSTCDSRQSATLHSLDKRCFRLFDFHRGKGATDYSCSFVLLSCWLVVGGLLLVGSAVCTLRRPSCFCFCLLPRENTPSKWLYFF